MEMESGKSRIRYISPFVFLSFQATFEMNLKYPFYVFYISDYLRQS